MASSEIRRDDGSLVVVGDRIVSEDHYATIKYIGEVPPTKGEWLGVEWDEPDRGKHDGKHNDKQYFTTKHETSGSFIRSQKVDFGIKFMTAVKDRYGLKTEDDAGVVTNELYVLNKNNKTTVVEMVGAKKLNMKQSKLEDLKEVDVKSMFVYGAGQDDIATLTPRIEMLNLGQNLVSSWKHVGDITRQLPNLTDLILSKNMLTVPENVDDLCPHFTHIKSLTFNKTYYTWKDILKCSKMLPSLDSLSFSYNELSSLVDSSQFLQNLTFLALENNHLKHWSEILHLGQLPKLGTLGLNENDIESVIFPDCLPGETTTLFSSLHTLYLHRNKISDWSSINELGKLKNLKELMFLFNPITESETMETVRQLQIAKIPTLTLLNRTEILAEERKGAEIDYLKRYGQQWRDSGGSQDSEKNKPSDEFIKQHPRYQFILEKWGAPEDSELVQKSTKLKDNLVCVKLECPQNPSKGIIEKKLPQTMTVAKVRGLVQRLFKADPSTLQLSYKSQKMDGPNIEMDNELRQLSFYSIENGDTVVVKW
ncbi:hypothetical protein LOTGIDRAFT_189635 [Lottia gigantea]|uniref:Tubulin-specific chaperone E n=1 Tax=Lottia gigantea TaxID=225164 RepID=V4AGM2_LOTGI|nr:hypothetical protein LOTGIDRAFT_189635 [Lottia gigantea]ESO94310.1 hypothetical protein LOTGIDRAFT_189635 [Lottia gigantea]